MSEYSRGGEGDEMDVDQVFFILLLLRHYFFVGNGKFSSSFPHDSHGGKKWRIE